MRGEPLLKHSRYPLCRLILVLCTGVISSCASGRVLEKPVTLELAAADCMEFQNSDGTVFREMIKNTYRFINSDSDSLFGDGERFDNYISAVRDVITMYDTYDRSGFSRMELEELKLMYLSWREQNRRYLQAVVRHMEEDSAGHQELLKVLETLVLFRIVLDNGTLQFLSDKIIRLQDNSEKDAVIQTFCDLLNIQSNPPAAKEIADRLQRNPGFPDLMKSLHIDGPPFIPDIPAARDSRWDTDRILARQELMKDNYPQDAEGNVFLRGVSFVPGDILLVNLIDESDGLFTNFTAEANYSYHSALYLEIEYEGKFFPVIYEAYEKGARIVPLITFVQPSYTGFIEILRWKNQDSVNRSVLSQAVLAYLELPHCFNLTLNDEVQGKSNYITCTTTFTRIIEKAGLPVPVHLSEISDPVLKNMESLKLFGKPFLTPTDFLYFAELKPTGIIDNGQFPLILAASLINNEYNMWLSHYSLNPTADPDYRFYLRAARAIIEGRGALLLKLFGYTEETFPYGTPETLAFILRLEEELEISVSIMRRYIESYPEIYISQESFSLQSSLANEALMVKVRDAMKRMETHFNM